MASERALRRLQHDMRELQRERVPGLVEALPEKDGRDLFTWNVKMRAECGPLEGQDVRMRLTFPPTYPSAPPDVRLLDPIKGHPNVFGDWICLDMLKDPEWHAKPYQGWSAAYSLAGVLQGLYGFLLVDDTVDQMYGNNARRRFKPHQTARGGSSSTPGTATPPSPPPAKPQQQQQQQRPPQQQQQGQAVEPLAGKLLQLLGRPGHTASGSALPFSSGGDSAQDGALDQLDDHLLRCVLGNLTPQDLWRCCAAGSARLHLHARDVLQRQELVCFFSKATFQEAVLGFGVYREWHADRPGCPGALKEAVVRTDYLALDAFVGAKVRRSAWNAHLDAFLPLYLNPEHGERALRVLPACLLHLGTSRQAPAPGSLSPAGVGTLEPRRLLTVLAQAVKSLVVEVVKVEDAKAKAGAPHDHEWWLEEPPAPGNVPTHMSDAALNGFAHLHHLLLAVALAPGGERVLALARQDLEAFCDRPSARHKSQCPDLGVLLVELLLVPKEAVPWSRLMPALLRECLSRHVRWVIKDVGDWFGRVAGESLGSTSEHTFRRMQTHFEKAGTGMRTVLLMCWFSNELARPATAAGAVRDLQAIKRAYDTTSGLPPPRAGARFNAFAREVMQTASWGAYLGHMRASVLSLDTCDARAMWGRVLRQAVVDSWVQGYHNGPTPWAEGTFGKLAPLPRLPAPPPAPQAASAAPASSSAGKEGGEEGMAGEVGRGKDNGGWTQVVKTPRRVVPDRLVVRTTPAHTVWAWGPNDRLRREAQHALGSPFVDWAGQAPVRALEGQGAW